jgi:hypothetical protein
MLQLKEKIGQKIVREGKHQVKLTPIEDQLHLQLLLDFRLRDRQVGGFLLRKGKLSEFTVVFGFACEGIHSSLMSEKLELAFDRLSTGLKDLPPNESITFHYQAFKSDTSRQAHLDELLDSTASEEVQFLLTGEKQRIQELASKGLREPKSLNLYVTYHCRPGNDVRSDWLERSLARLESFLAWFKGDGECRRAAELHTLLQHAYSGGFLGWEQLLSTKLALPVRALSPGELWTNLWNRFNRSEPIPIPQILSIDERRLEEVVNNETHGTTLLCSDAVPYCGRSFVRLEKNHYLGLLTFLEKPGGWRDKRSQLHYLWEAIAKDLVTDTEIFVEISPANPLLVRTSIQRLLKQSTVNAQRAEKFQNVDVVAEQHASRSVALQTSLCEGELPFHTAVAFVIHRPSRSQLDEACSFLANHFHRPAWVARETDIAWKIWLQTLPIVDEPLLVAPFLNRRQLYLNNEVLGFLPIVKTQSQGKEGLELIGEDGGMPIFLDLFTQLQNLAIFGTTRSGKSVLVSGLLTQALARGIPIVALDYPKPDGTSTFTDYTYFLEKRGAYFDIGKEQINLFDRPDLSRIPQKEREARFADFQDYLCNCLQAMVTGGSAAPLLSQTIRTVLYCALHRFFNDPEISRRYDAAAVGGLGSSVWQDTPTLQDFLPFCSLTTLNEQLQLEQGIEWNAVPQALEQIRLRLNYWLTSRIGKAISSPSSISSQAQLLVFALRQLSQSEDAAILSLVSYAAALRRALSFPVSIFFIDESPILFQFRDIANLVRMICANGAKSGIRVILSAQDPNTIEATDAIGQGIFQNLHVRLVGRLERNALPSFERIFQYPSEIIQQCQTFRSNPQGIYTRWLLDDGGNYTFCRYYPAYVQPTFSRFLNKGNNIFDRLNRGSAKCVFVNRST